MPARRSGGGERRMRTWRRLSCSTVITPASPRRRLPPPPHQAIAGRRPSATAPANRSQHGVHGRRGRRLAPGVVGSSPPPRRHRWPASTSGGRPPALVLPQGRVPQLRGGGRALAALTGFHVHPRARAGARAGSSTAPGRAERCCRRSTSATTPCPSTSPEPDVIHEIIGRAGAGQPGFADPTRRPGRTSRRSSGRGGPSSSAASLVALEFGVVPRTASCGVGRRPAVVVRELGALPGAEIRPWDLRAVGRFDYDITAATGAVRRPFGGQAVDDLGGILESSTTRPATASR